MDDWNEFLNFLKEVKQGKVNNPAFAPMDNGNIPKTWEEVVERVKELPDDDPITWLELTDKVNCLKLEKA